MTTFWNWLDSADATPFFGWLAVVMLTFTVAGHFWTWRNRPGAR